MMDTIVPHLIGLRFLVWLKNLSLSYLLIVLFETINVNVFPLATFFPFTRLMVAVFNLQVVSNAILATIRALLGLVFYPNYRTLYDRVQGFISCSVLLLSRISVYFLIGGGLEQARVRVCTPLHSLYWCPSRWALISRPYVTKNTCHWVFATEKKVITLEHWS